MQRMTDAQRALAEKNLPLVTWCLQNRITHWTPDEYEDLFQDGALGLCKAALHFDERRGVKFGTFACECIYGEIANTLRVRRRRQRKHPAVSLEAPLSGGMEEITLGATIPGREDGRSMEGLLILRETLARIKGRDRDALCLHMQGFRQVEIGRRLGMSQPTTHRVLKRSRQLIADEYARQCKRRERTE